MVELRLYILQVLPFATINKDCQLGRLLLGYGMNKVITIIRHAKSDWSDACNDFDRSINRRGQSDATLIGEYLHDNDYCFDAVFCSCANRAKLTAQIITSHIKQPTNNSQFEDSLYLASRTTLTSFIENVEDCYQQIAIIGHNPGLTELCNYLADDELQNLPTCAVYSIQLCVDDWKAVGAGCGTRIKLITPRILKDV